MSCLCNVQNCCAIYDFSNYAMKKLPHYLTDCRNLLLCCLSSNPFLCLSLSPTSPWPPTAAQTPSYHCPNFAGTTPQMPLP